jgi:hypothetical protein
MDITTPQVNTLVQLRVLHLSYTDSNQLRNFGIHLFYVPLVIRGNEIHFKLNGNVIFYF